MPQINLAMLFGQKSGLPVYFHRPPGNINDVPTLHDLVETFKALEVGRMHYVMDKGFYSRKNVDDLKVISPSSSSMTNDTLKSRWRCDWAWLAGCRWWVQVSSPVT